MTTQSLILSELFAAAGYSVLAVSDRLNRYARLVEIVRTLWRAGRSYDVLILDVFGGPSFVVEDLASWIARFFGRPIVMFLRGGAMPSFLARYPRWGRRVLRRADVMLAPSPFLVRALAPYGIAPRVLPNVIDLSNYPYRKRRALAPRLLWMRAFHPIWNPAMAIRVLARLRAFAPEATLVMAGEDKGLEQEMRTLARELGVEPAVQFAGFLDRAGKQREGGAADIYLNTNRIDNMPVSVVEACAMGLPVVATNVGGIPDLLTHEDTALLVPDEDDEAMTSAILRLLREPDLAERLSEQGRQLAERSAWSQILPQWEEIFEQLRRNA